MPFKAAPQIEFVLEKTMNPPKSMIAKVFEAILKMGNFFGAGGKGLILFFSNLGKLIMKCFRKENKAS